MTRPRILLCCTFFAAVTAVCCDGRISAQSLPAATDGAPAPAPQAPTGTAGPPRMGQKPQAPEISTALTVTVEGRTQTFTLQQIDGMPQRSVTVHNGHTNVDESYTGVAVSDLLARSGLNADAQAAHRQLLHSYLRATGTDFYYVLYSAVEMEGSLHTGEVIVATRRNGQPLRGEGKLMLISTEDKQPARWVHNLTSLTLSSVE